MLEKIFKIFIIMTIANHKIYKFIFKDSLS